MDTQNNYQEHEIANNADIEYSKPSKSRFLFLLFFFGFFVFSWAGCYQLSKFNFKNNADIKVPESSLYTPKYK